MKTLVLANQKGGVGKSAVACQFAYYLAELLEKRVLVIDLDHQCNTSRAIRLSSLANVSTVSSSAVLTTKTDAVEVEEGRFVLVPGDATLIKMERQADKHNSFATHLNHLIKALDSRFDVCIIDTNPNPDIRVTAALVVAGYVLSPIQLNQEALDGIVGLRNDVAKVKAALNPKLQLIGILPNLVERTPFQKANFQQLAEHFSNLMIRLDNGAMAAIQTRTAVAEAQAAGQPIWKLGKTSAREAWGQIKPIFDKVAATMGVHNA